MTVSFISYKDGLPYRYDWSDWENDFLEYPRVGQQVVIPAFGQGPWFVDYIEWHPYSPYPEVHIYLRGAA